MVETMRLGIALQPIATALFANSPFRDGKPTGYLSWRSHVWTDTDPDRCASCRESSGDQSVVDDVLTAALNSCLSPPMSVSQATIRWSAMGPRQG